MILCPTCQRDGVVSNANVYDTRTNRNGTEIRRKRRCVRDGQHVFETREASPELGLDDVYVRRGSDDAISSKFSQSRLRNDVSDGVLKRLSPDAIDAVVSDVCGTLRENLEAISTPITALESRDHSIEGLAVTIYDYQIMEAVENSLRSGTDRIARVLYCLSFRGRVDVPKRHGFKDATDFLAWFHSDEAYADLGQPIPQKMDRATETWWPPRVPGYPERVIKKNGTVKQFGLEQLRKSLLRALHGRYHAQDVSRLIVQMILFRIEGQASVLSSQLASEAMSILRMWDDIAYLRYAGIGKGFTSVRSFQEEAFNLISTPSPKLVFDRKMLKAPFNVRAFHSALPDPEKHTERPLREDRGRGA